MSRHQLMHLHPQNDNPANGLELALRFVLWAQQLRSVPSAKQIREHFDCSFASSYRWRAAWLAANGITPPSKEHKPCTVTPTKP